MSVGHCRHSQFSFLLSSSILLTLPWQRFQILHTFSCDRRTRECKLSCWSVQGTLDWGFLYRNTYIIFLRSANWKFPMERKKKQICGWFVMEKPLFFGMFFFKGSTILGSLKFKHSLLLSTPSNLQKTSGYDS